MDSRKIDFSSMYSNEFVKNCPEGWAVKSVKIDLDLDDSSRECRFLPRVMVEYATSKNEDFGIQGFFLTHEMINTIKEHINGNSADQKDLPWFLE